MHTPLQRCCIAAHEGVEHMPAMHESPGLQAFPHAPQLRGSVEVSVHPPAQGVCVPGQLLVTHVPATHAEPIAHTRPHAPQLLLSLSVERHTVPQSVCPPGHKPPPSVRSETIASRMPPSGPTEAQQPDVQSATSTTRTKRVSSICVFPQGELPHKQLPVQRTTFTHR